MPTPAGAGVFLAMLALLLSLLALAIVGARVYARLKLKCFALDDLFMCTALVRILVCSNIVSQMQALPWDPVRQFTGVKAAVGGQGSEWTGATVSVRGCRCR